MFSRAIAHPTGYPETVHTLTPAHEQTCSSSLVCDQKYLAVHQSDSTDDRLFHSGRPGSTPGYDRLLEHPNCDVSLLTGCDFSSDRDPRKAAWTDPVFRRIAQPHQSRRLLDFGDHDVQLAKLISIKKKQNEKSAIADPNHHERDRHVCRAVSLARTSHSGCLDHGCCADF